MLALYEHGGTTIERKRNKQIVFRLSDEEHDQLKKQVAKSGLKQQDFILRAVLNRPITNTEGLKELVPQLKAIGNNLNQLTRLANAGYPINNAELTTMRKELNEQWQLLNQYTRKQN